MGPNFDAAFVDPEQGKPAFTIEPHPDGTSAKVEWIQSYLDRFAPDQGIVFEPGAPRNAESLVIFRFDTGPERPIWRFLGAKKVIFLFALLNVDGHHGDVASGTLSIRGPEVYLGRLGSVLYTLNRLHRIRWRLDQYPSISLSSPQNFRSNSPGFVFRA